MERNTKCIVKAGKFVGRTGYFQYWSGNDAGTELACFATKPVNPDKVDRATVWFFVWLNEFECMENVLQ